MKVGCIISCVGVALELENIWRFSYFYLSLRHRVWARIGIFAVSLIGCFMVVYGIYTDKSYDIVSVLVTTVIFDIIVVLLVAFMIMVSVFSLWI